MQHEINWQFGHPQQLSIGDLIKLEPNFGLYCYQIDFKWTFLTKYEARFSTVETKSIKSATNIIEIFDFDQKRSKRDPKSQFISTFLIKFDFFD